MMKYIKNNTTSQKKLLTPPLLITVVLYQRQLSINKIRAKIPNKQVYQKYYRRSPFLINHQ
ncbi:hypothetical protein M23134_00372 [Microscilla marina ATCC 23134]|uniref:Uncharacterized protein n=1 Tax=Microscilla marina ATCC 23134 TaxID=313606 RepID=A1ZIV2_MICM2|nr:hypothetical protein M23134_00372 [Microscilla marina ATCC 23134]